MYSIVSNLHLYLDRSAFKGVNGVTSSDGFRVYSAYTTFVYSQLQVILPNSFLGDISNWDYFMSIDLTAPDLPLKTASDLLKNKDFANLVKESELPTPSRFVEQALCFHKNVCILLLKQKLCKSKLVRGFSIFDEAVIRYGQEVDYTHESGVLCDYLVQHKWISPSVKPLFLSEYGSFVEKFRSQDISYEGSWIGFMSEYYELQSRENLFAIFKLCCLSLSGVHSFPPEFTLTLPELASDFTDFQSLIRSIQSSLVGIPNVTELYANPRTASSVFSLLGRGRSLIEDERFSVWDLTSTCSSRRRRISNQLDSRYTCTISDDERSWVGLQEKSATTSPVQSPPKFAVPTPIQTGSGPPGNSSKNVRKSPVLGTAVLSVPRFNADVPFLPEPRAAESKKLVVKKKNSGGK